MSYIDDVQFIEGSIDVYQEICAELARLNQRKVQQAETVTNCLLPLLQNLLDVWEAKAPHYAANSTEFFGEQAAKEVLLQAQRRFLPTTAQGVCLRRETVGNSLIDVGFLGETTSCSPTHLYFQFAGESRYEMSIPLEIMDSFCAQEDVKGRQQVFADWLDSLMNQNRIRPLPVLETDLPEMIAASCSLFNVGVPQPGAYVVTGRQANNRHGEKGWHHYFGYVVQVRMQPDAEGGPIVLIRHPDGQLGCHVNQTYSLLKGIWLKKAKECFPPGLSPEAEDYTRPFYYKGGEAPAVGRIVEYNSGD